MTGAELRPCPNCGGTNIITWTIKRSDRRDKWSYLCCRNCGLQTLGDFETKKARTYWNEGTGRHFEDIKNIPYTGADE